MLQNLSKTIETAALELLERAYMKPGSILLVGCSTSEVRGQRIGSAGSLKVAEAIFQPLFRIVNENSIFLAVQCCEHLNRALVVERTVSDQYQLEQVSVYPTTSAGGSLAALAMDLFQDPVVVGRIQAHAGLDIGHTLIGMHLKAVAVPTRLSINQIGETCLVAARSRPRLIGGIRAVYTKPGTEQPSDKK